MLNNSNGITEVPPGGARGVGARRRAGGLEEEEGKSDEEADGGQTSTMLVKRCKETSVMLLLCVNKEQTDTLMYLYI